MTISHAPLRLPDAFYFWRSWGVKILMRWLTSNGYLKPLPDKGIVGLVVGQMLSQ
jgi:hypothetical protein